ncbi:DUF2336 domain-containing protein [Caulobacter sp. NIBR2454]|uniref:DUF2336 domain-containing protein n=1 Tax=Caulobacter sp. NIBR2454 TaxID=3015996 RepID=UPI0022B63C71|nr:DUF2336 domain-containing protein [Caulobacter sp. NIBR2454]
MAQSSRLSELINLAYEPSSERRRDLLRSLTDLFFCYDSHGAAELDLFDDVMTQLSGEMEQAVRVELAGRMADAASAPLGLVRGLAADEFAVAEPILARSNALTEDDLLQVARTQGQDHLRAISSRQSGVTMAVSDAIVERADDQTLGVLVRNEAAELSRGAHETVVDRANANPELHEAVVFRKSLPIDLLNEMYFVVEARLRDQIMERNAQLDPAALEAALSAGRKHVAASDGALPADHARAEREVRRLIIDGALDAPVLAAMLRNRETTKFLVALAELADIDFHTARRILERRELDALAIVCKAAKFDRTLFLTFAVLILGPEADAMARAKEYGDLYTQLPHDAAMRTLRFWRIRRQTGDVQAA